MLTEGKPEEDLKREWRRAGWNEEEVAAFWDQHGSGDGKF